MTIPANPSSLSFRPVVCHAVDGQACCVATGADVWLIDDDLPASFIMGQLIRHQRFAEQVCSFTQAAEAVNRLNLVLRNAPARLPRLILLDIRMTSPDGQGFLDAYAQLPATIRQRVAVYVLLDSFEPIELLRASCYQYVRGFLAKPLTAEDLQTIQG